jgi:D-proline reductase (dithiol) PrdB
MPVDSFRYLSRLIARYYRLTQVEDLGPIPWTPLERPLDQCIFGLVTSGGLFNSKQDPPFDLERERREPTWGDPSYRAIPADVHPSDLGVSHFHIRAEHVLEDMNILMPIQRFKELAEQRQILKLADHAYSFMGYQGFPADLHGWKQVYGPQVAERMRAEEVNCVFLTTA